MPWTRQRTSDFRNLFGYFSPVHRKRSLIHRNGPFMHRLGRFLWTIPAVSLSPAGRAVATWRSPGRARIVPGIGTARTPWQSRCRK